MGTSIRGENPAALPGKVLAHQIRTAAGKNEKGTEPWVMPGNKSRKQPFREGYANTGTGRLEKGGECVSIKIKVSYESPEELQEVLERLRPMLTNAKVKLKKGRYELAYIELNTERTPRRR